MSDAPNEIVKAELADVPQRELPQPPLSISHLMLWILGSAAVLGSDRWLAEPDGDGVRQLLLPLEQLVRSVTMGAGAAAILIFARRLVIRDAPLPSQAGHWVLLLQGFYWPAHWLLVCWIYGLRGAEIVQARDWGSYQRYAMGTALYYLWGTALYLAALMGLREAGRWRMFFVTAAVLPLLHALLWCCILSEPRLWRIQTSFVFIRIAVTLAFIAVCVLRDRKVGIRRDWMHAAGVGLYVLGSVWYLALYLAYMFLPRDS